MKTLGAIVILIGVVVYLSFGTLSPCGMLRENARRHDNLAAVLPDSVVDFALAAQYGALSPGRCVSILLGGQSAPVVATPATQQPTSQQQASRVPPTSEEAFRAAFNNATAAMTECRNKRISGELKSYVASVQCSNPRVALAFAVVKYRYMDLIALMNAKRLEIADRMDRGELTEIQGQAENSKVYSQIVEAERRRDTGR